MAQTPVSNPYLIVQQITDQYVRKNFENLQNYFNTQNQLLDFQFFERVFTSAVTGFQIAHGLTYAPLDIIVTKITGTGTITFKYALFTTTNIIVDVSGPCRIRFFAGTYSRFQSSVEPATTDTTSYSATPSSGGGSTLTGDVTGTPLGGSTATTISPSVVTNAKLAAMAAHTYKGNNTGAPASPLDLTAAQLTAELNQFTTAVQGVVPASGGGTSNFLRADGAWTTPASAATPYYSGYQNGTWSGSSTSLIDGANAGGNTLTQRTGTGLTVTAAASNILGITFTPASVTAVYRIECSFIGSGQSNGAVAAFSLTDGTTIIDTAQMNGVGVAPASGWDTHLKGPYTPGTTSPVTIKVQMAAIGGGTTKITDVTAGLVPVIRWRIEQK